MRRKKLVLGTLGSAAGIAVALGLVGGPAMAVAVSPAVTTGDAPVVLGGENAVCTVGTDASGVVSVESAGGALLDVTFDLTRLPESVTSVTVPTLIAGTCRNSVHTVTFTGSPNITEMVVEPSAFDQNLWGNALVSVVFPEGVENLDIQSRAFYQYSWGVDNALTDIVFPSTLKTMHIGSAAFQQARVDKSNGNNTLEKVIFPEGLEDLVIDQYGFYQIAGESLENTNSLSEISFPSTLKNLEIGYRAFSQWSMGGPNALTEIYFPDSLERLILGQDAFYQSKNDQNKLKYVSIPSGLKELSLGSGVFTSPTFPVLLEFRTGEVPGEIAQSLTLGFQVLAPNGQWFWYGETSRTSQVWGSSLKAGSYDYPITGYRQLDFALDGGQLDDFEGSESRFVYPEGEGHVASWSGVPEYTGVTPAWPYGRHWLTLPEPTKAGHTFLGWCEYEPVGESCQDATGGGGGECACGRERV